MPRGGRVGGGGGGGGELLHVKLTETCFLNVTSKKTPLDKR